MKRISFGKIKVGDVIKISLTKEYLETATPSMKEKPIIVRVLEKHDGVNKELRVKILMRFGKPSIGKYHSMHNDWIRHYEGLEIIERLEKWDLMMEVL